MFEKSQKLMELLIARNNRKKGIEERHPTVLFMLMSAIESYSEDQYNNEGNKYDTLAVLLSSPVDGGASYAEIYSLTEPDIDSLTSDDVSSGINDAKRGEDKQFIRAIINCIWENTSKFPFLTCKLTDPEEFEDGEEASLWAALAYADLHTFFIGGHSATSRQASESSSRADEMVRILDDIQIAQQRIAYSLDTGFDRVSFADLRIEFLPEELEQVHFLRDLDLRNTKIRTLPNLSKFKSLRIVNCSYMLITDIEFVRGCESLETLYIGVSDVQSLNGIEGARNLRNFYCGSTYVTDVSPLGSCTRLEHVSCENLHISSLSGLQNCPDLHTVDCGTTQITSLEPLEGAHKLKRLVVSRCHITDNSEAIWTKRSLKEVTFFEGSLGTVPPEILSKTARDNCQHRLLEYFKLNDEMVGLQALKVFILGNGGVGKTQLAGLLMNHPFAPEKPSTHGVDVHSLLLPTGDRSSPVESRALQIWDFGGQELYHGIHALFLRRRIIYVLAWSLRHEAGRYDDRHGGVFENFPLPYWLSFIRSGGSSTSPLIVVETKIDESQGIADDEIQPLIEGFDLVQRLRVSAIDDRDTHRADLLDAIEVAKEQVNSRGPTKIPRRWLHVIDDVIALRKGMVTGAGSKFSITASNQKASITSVEFDAICSKHGVEEGRKVLLEFIDSIGEVIYRPGFKDDLIIVDQNAAFSAIYQVASRGRFYELLKKNAGRFTLSDLAAASDQTTADAARLLDLMLSFGTCFETYRINGDVTYIAPIGLPTPPSVDVSIVGWEVLKEVYEYEFLHDGFFHSLISRVGMKLRADADYWIDGVYYFDKAHSCSLCITRKKLSGVRAKITVEAQYPPGNDPAPAFRYLSDIDAVIEEQEFDSGISLFNNPSTRQRRISALNSAQPILVQHEPSLETPSSVGGIIRELMKALFGMTPARVASIEISMGYPVGKDSKDKRAMKLVTESFERKALKKLNAVMQHAGG